MMTPPQPSLVQTLSRRWRSIETDLHAKARKAGEDDDLVDRLTDEALTRQKAIEDQIAEAHAAGPEDAAALLDLVLSLWSDSYTERTSIFHGRDVRLVKRALEALRRKPTTRNSAGGH